MRSQRTEAVVGDLVRLSFLRRSWSWGFLRLLHGAPLGAPGRRRGIFDMQSIREWGADGSRGAKPPGSGSPGCIFQLWGTTFMGAIWWMARRRRREFAPEGRMELLEPFLRIVGSCLGRP
jgi:hypothetical protein